MIFFFVCDKLIVSPTKIVSGATKGDAVWILNKKTGESLRLIYVVLIHKTLSQE
jgi:hypothetical protein